MSELSVEVPFPMCPSCGGCIPNEERVGEYSGAISRREPHVEICSMCGVVEALEDWFGTCPKVDG